MAKKLTKPDAERLLGLLGFQRNERYDIWVLFGGTNGRRRSWVRAYVSWKQVSLEASNGLRMTTRDRKARTAKTLVQQVAFLRREYPAS